MLLAFERNDFWGVDAAGRPFVAPWVASSNLAADPDTAFTVLEVDPDSAEAIENPGILHFVPSDGTGGGLPTFGSLLFGEQYLPVGDGYACKSVMRLGARGNAADTAVFGFHDLANDEGSGLPGFGAYMLLTFVGGNPEADPVVPDTYSIVGAHRRASGSGGIITTTVPGSLELGKFYKFTVAIAPVLWGIDQDPPQAIMSSQITFDVSYKEESVWSDVINVGIVSSENPVSALVHRLMSQGLFSHVAVDVDKMEVGLNRQLVR